MKNNKLNFNLKWWKFDKYEWHDHKELGPIIRPAHGAKFSEYNPWELNEKKKSSSMYNLPLYGSLLSEIDAQKYEELLITINSYSENNLQQNDENIETLADLQSEKIRLEAHIKRQILVFAEEYGLLGVFFNYANKMVCPTFWHPIFDFKKTDFSNNKKPSYFKSEYYLKINSFDNEVISLDFNHLDYFYYQTIGRQYHDILFDFYNHRKIPEELYLKTVIPLHHIDFFDGAEWKRTQTKANLNQKGLDYFEGKNFDELINLGEHLGIVDEKYLEKSSEPGLYYNVKPPSLEQQWYIDNKRPYYEITSMAPLEFFIPFKYQSHYFKKKGGTNYILPSILYAHVNNPTRTWDEKNGTYNYDKKDEYYSDYFESLTDIIIFISTLQETAELENKKKSLADGTFEIMPENITGNISDSIDINSNIFLNKFISRNYTRTDYSNIENPITFRSPSLAGMISEMFLRDKLDGQQYRKCAYEKCNRWSIMRDNQLYCKKPRTCEQKANYYKRKNKK